MAVLVSVVLGSDQTGAGGAEERESGELHSEEVGSWSTDEVERETRVLLKLPRSGGSSTRVVEGEDWNKIVEVEGAIVRHS